MQARKQARSKSGWLRDSIFRDNAEVKTIVRVPSTETAKECCCYEANSRNKKGVLREEGVANVGTQINWEDECCALHSAQLNRKKYRRAVPNAKMEGWQVNK